MPSMSRVFGSSGEANQPMRRLGRKAATPLSHSFGDTTRVTNRSGRAALSRHFFDACESHRSLRFEHVIARDGKGVDAFGELHLEDHQPFVAEGHFRARE